MSKTAICFKTHIWNKGIHNFIKKIYKDCDDSNKKALNNFKGEFDLDFYVLIPDYLEKNINQDIIKFTKIYKEEDIKNLYKNGFYSMWISNHFIELWFNKTFGEKYEYIWFIDYDVKILGDTNYFWRSELTEDLLIPRNMTLLKENWKFYDYVHESLLKEERYMCPKQFYRISKKLLIKLDELFESGINGHNEIIIGSICKKFNFTYNSNFLNQTIQGIWTENPEYSKYNYENYNKLINNVNSWKPYIFHPIKNLTKEEEDNEIKIRSKYDKILLEEDNTESISNKYIKNPNTSNKNNVRKIIIKKKI